MAKKEKQERVAVSLPRGTKYSAYVAVNGVAYNIPAKGTHEVPPEIAEELARSEWAEDMRDANNAAMLKAVRAEQEKTEAQLKARRV